MPTIFDVLSTLKTLNLRLYRNDWSNAKRNAQQNLSGLSHYADDATLRFHHARILECHAISDGAFLKVIESVALDPDNTARGFRVVLFDVFGDAVYRPKLEQTCSTKHGAITAYLSWRIEFDDAQYYLDTLTKRLDTQQKKLEVMSDALDVFRSLFKTARV